MLGSFFFRFFDLLKDSSEPLWDKFTNHSKLLVVAQVFIIKSNYWVSKVGYDIIIKWVRKLLFEGNRLKEKFYDTKSIMNPPCILGYKKINICINFFMVYYCENIDLTKCKTCGHAQYKLKTGRAMTLFIHKKLRYFSITPRQKRLFISPTIVIHVMWHHSHNTMDWVMIHPFDREAWKKFNRVHP